MEIGPDNRDQKRRSCVQHQRLRFPGRKDLDLLSPYLEIRSVLAWGSSPHLASQSNQVNLLPNHDMITFGVDGDELCSETKWPNDGVGRNSQSDTLLGRFGWFLGLFAEQAFHLRCRGLEKTKVVDPQSQTLTVAPLVGVVRELCMSTAV